MTNNGWAPPDKRNVQGLIIRGYSHPYSCHMLFKFADASGAGTFIKGLLPYLQSAEDWGAYKPVSMLNIGLTYNGIVTIDSRLQGLFPPTFMQGPASGNSQDALQDKDHGESDPSYWWYKNFAPDDIDAVVHVYALTANALAELVQIVAHGAQAAGVTELFPMADKKSRLEQYELPDEKVYFGYRDGIDNPDLNWPPDPSKTAPGDLNNFVIGYPGTSSPDSIDPGPTQGEAGAFAKDGCYNAFRVFYQDVELFDTFLAQNAPSVAQQSGMSVAAASDWLAAKLVGRWFNGSPLILSPDGEDPKTSGATDFGYAGDPNGVRCPFSAHSRVGNPRDETLKLVDRPLRRLARRGMPYGTPPNPPNYDGDRGLIGLFLCGGLAEQFELIYTWINTNNFSPVFSTKKKTGEKKKKYPQDAVLANRENPNVVTSFTIPMQNGSSIVIPSLPQFLVTRGTAYFLLPSISTLRGIGGVT